MSDITLAMVKELRERTGVGMSKCKDALVRADANIEKAIDILRKEGMASAVKKESREAKEGYIGCAQNDSAISLIELNCETDFVAQNEIFKVFLDDLTTQVINEKPSSIDDLLNAKFISDTSMTVEDYKNSLVQRFGENIQLKRMLLIEKKPNVSYGIYSHMGGKIASITAIQGSENVQDIAKNISMHVAAETPEYLKPEDIEEKVLDKEREIARSQIQNKPENIIEKIIEGKINSFYDAVCLLRQKYIKDSSITVFQYLKQSSDKLNAELQINNFWIWKIGA